MIVIIFSYMEIVRLTIFLTKNFPVLLARDTDMFAKTRKKFFENSMTPFQQNV